MCMVLVTGINRYRLNVNQSTVYLYNVYALTHIYTPVQIMVLMLDVTQNMYRTHEGKQVFSELKINFLNAFQMSVILEEKKLIKLNFAFHGSGLELKNWIRIRTDRVLIFVLRNLDREAAKKTSSTNGEAIKALPPSTLKLNGHRIFFQSSKKLFFLKWPGLYLPLINGPAISGEHSFLRLPYIHILLSSPTFSWNDFPTSDSRSYSWTTGERSEPGGRTTACLPQVSKST